MCIRRRWRIVVLAALGIAISFGFACLDSTDALDSHGISGFLEVGEVEADAARCPTCTKFSVPDSVGFRRSYYAAGEPIVRIEPPEVERIDKLSYDNSELEPDASSVVLVLTPSATEKMNDAARRSRASRLYVSAGSDLPVLVVERMEFIGA
jgi:hypothetical protein